MSPFVIRWLKVARDRASACPGDRIVFAEAVDTRPQRPRRVVVGAVVDGRKDKPGVLISALAEGAEGGGALSYQECGVSTIEHARAVIAALNLAWPELRKETSTL